MKAMLAALVAMAVISVGAWFGLNEYEYLFSNDTSRENVRLD